MPALSSKVRSDLLSLISDELAMVNAKAEDVAAKHWAIAEDEVAKELGYFDNLTRIEHIKNQIEGLQNELSHLESMISERARQATLEDYRLLNLRVTADHLGKVHRKPNVFGRLIATAWDCLVLQKINEQVPFIKVYEGLSQLHHVVKRELLLTGNYVEARELYNRFHSKVIEAIGAEIPGLLSEVQALPALQNPLTED